MALLLFSHISDFLHRLPPNVVPSEWLQLADIAQLGKALSYLRAVNQSNKNSYLMNTVVYRCTKKCASKTVFLPYSRLDSWKQIQTVKL